MSTQAFLYTGGHFIDSITVARRDALASKPYSIDMGNSILSLSTESANTLLIGLATVLYDNGDLTMETAERLQYLSSSVLADREIRRCACVCGCDYKLEGYAPGEDVCGACLDNCQQEKCPNCGGNGATGPDYDPDPCNACRGTGIKA